MRRVDPRDVLSCMHCFINICVTSSLLRMRKVRRLDENVTNENTTGSQGRVYRAAPPHSPIFLLSFIPYGSVLFSCLFLPSNNNVYDGSDGRLELVFFFHASLSLIIQIIVREFIRTSLAVSAEPCAALHSAMNQEVPAA